MNAGSLSLAPPMQAQARALQEGLDIVVGTPGG